jgi:hypothetical protein
MKERREHGAWSIATQRKNLLDPPEAGKQDCLLRCRFADESDITQPAVRIEVTPIQLRASGSTANAGWSESWEVLKTDIVDEIVYEV